MAEVDPLDDSIVRYVIRRHSYDPATRHFKWFDERAFDNKKEFEASLQEAGFELERRQVKGQAHHKEQIMGQVLAINYLVESKSRRKMRKAEGAFVPATFKARLLFALSTKRFLLSNRRRRRWFDA